MNILTFDIEDWYNHDDYSQDFEWDKFEVRIYEGVDKILETLNYHNLKASFMCLGWLAEKHPKIIEKINNEGHHIGCHSYQHQLATRFNKTEFKEDTYKAKSLIEDICGKEVNAYRVPSFSVTTSNIWLFETLIELGFKYDCSVFPAKHEFGGIQSFPDSPSIIKTSSGCIKEFPINLGNILGREIIYSGGGYFRVIPYCLLKKMMNKSTYIMSYFHPSDFDPKQPNMPHLPIMRQIKNRIGLKGSYKKFYRLLSDFKFIDLPTADSQIEWDKCQIIDIQEL